MPPVHSMNDLLSQSREIELEMIYLKEAQHSKKEGEGRVSTWRPSSWPGGRWTSPPSSSWPSRAGRSASSGTSGNACPGIG